MNNNLKPSFPNACVGNPVSLQHLRSLDPRHKHYFGFPVLRPFGARQSLLKFLQKILSGMTTYFS